jgi:hypothetical protein
VTGERNYELSIQLVDLFKNFIAPRIVYTGAIYEEVIKLTAEAIYT